MPGLGRPDGSDHSAGEYTLEDLLGGVIEALSAELVDVDLSVQEGLLFTGDHAQLQLLSQNRLANASKYRAPGRPLVIVVHGQDAGSETIVHVDDTGIGFAPEETERIFDLRVRGERVGDVPGLGLGLATCRSIVEHHGGTIEAQPRAEGGSRFTVRLPHRVLGVER
ncbi:MAG: ATP-binding protein [Nitriliruptoraceae bacterium]